VLPLFQGAPSPGTVMEVCLGLPFEQIEAVRARLPAEGLTPRDHVEGLLHSDDPFGYLWTLMPPHVPFLSNGDLAGRWLEV
jgi:hypothetical protein